MSDMKFSIEALSIILVKKYERNSHIKGYHAYMVKWIPTTGDFLKARLEPEFDKFAVAAEICCSWTFIKRKNWSIRKS